jgi:hypothetical protein
MEPGLARLRRALADVALPPRAQLGRFPIADSAAAELMREYEQAHSAAEVSRAEWLPPTVRQTLDELAYQFMEANPLMYCEPAVDYCSDEFLRESTFWAEARELAAKALRMLADADP